MLHSANPRRGNKMAIAATPQATSTVDKSVAAKWSKLLAAAGWTSFPNVVFERQQAPGVAQLDIDIVRHLQGK
jgi:hypothetical protein